MSKSKYIYKKIIGKKEIEISEKEVKRLISVAQSLLHSDDLITVWVKNFNGSISPITIRRYER